MGLMAHVNTTEVTRDQVLAVAQPEFTETWKPHGHGTVLKMVEDAVVKKGMEIIKSRFAMDKRGNKMFGVLETSQQYNGANLTVGIRNSVDKSFSVGVCAGSRVFVCDNLAFSAEFVAMRKHTSGLDEEQLFILAEKSVGKVQEKMGIYAKWHSGLKEVEVREGEAQSGHGEAYHKALVYDLLDRGAFAPSQYRSFTECLAAEVTLHGNSMYAYHGAVTRMMRKYGLFTQHERSVSLNYTINQHLPYPRREENILKASGLDQATEVIDAEEVEA